MFIDSAFSVAGNLFVLWPSYFFSMMVSRGITTCAGAVQACYCSSVHGPLRSLAARVWTSARHEATKSVYLSLAAHDSRHVYVQEAPQEAVETSRHVPPADAVPKHSSTEHPLTPEAAAKKVRATRRPSRHAHPPGGFSHKSALVCGSTYRSHAGPLQYIGMTGAQIIHEMLREHGVEVVFGYPGGAILPVYDAIHESPHFKFVLPRREDGGGHMAEGYARVTGKPGVVLVTSGPGATNIVTPLVDALMDGTPMVALTGQVATALIGTDAFQEADVVGIMRPATKWTTLVKDVRDLPRAINEAFAIATSGRPGPVLIDLPKDVTAAVLRETPDVAPRVARRMAEKSAIARARMGLSPEQREKIARLINECERPVIYAGQGILSAGAVAELRQLAAQGNIPVTTTLLGMGAFDEMDPRSLHMLGMHGSVYANYAMQEADCILALGARFDDRITGGWIEAAQCHRAKCIYPDPSLPAHSSLPPILTRR